MYRTMKALACATVLALVCAVIAPRPAAAATGFHAAWLDQSPWPVLSPGATTSYTVRFRNTGDQTWQRGVAGRQVNLAVSGDSTAFADAGMAVGWLNANRVATTVEDAVAPSAIATFTFTLRAPSAPGPYRLPLHPVLEGVQHLEDEGVFVLVVSDLGFHSRWVSQSAYPTLQPGQTSQPLNLVFRNTGSRTWNKGILGEEARLGINMDDAQWAPQLANNAVSGIRAEGEAGAMGLAIDPGFAANHFVYVCASRTDSGWLNQVLRYREANNVLTLDGFVIRTGIFAGGNHDGCRIRFGPAGKLWITMGEVGNTAFSQNPNALNGKILRMNPDGTVPEDNPILPGAFGRTAAYTMGHRNPQGLAVQPGSGLPFTSEHAHYTDGATGAHSHATRNLLRAGANYSWPLGAGAGFTKPVWQSLDNPYVATSGNTFVSGTQWGAWNGNLFLAALAGSMLLRLEPQADGTFKTAQTLYVGTYGRLRAAAQGPDGSLYVSTDNGAGVDRIIRITPTP